MSVCLTNQQSLLSLNPNLVEEKTARLLKALGRPEAEVSILVVDDREMAAINGQYRGRPQPTNVIAFAQNDGRFGGLNPDFLGDVVISAETIQREARELGYEDGEIFYFYLIHGLLHLLGYDHERSPADERAQEDETQRLWELIGHEL